MALSVTVGAKQLLQLGVSLSDVALLIKVGGRFGNFLGVGRNDADILEAIQEDPSALLKRRDLIDPTSMKQKWSSIRFVYQGQHHRKAGTFEMRNESAELTNFSWMTVVIVSVLDLCLPSSHIKTLLVTVLTKILDGDEDIRDTLNLMMSTNIDTWRSMGSVRGTPHNAATAMRKTLLEKTGDKFVHQLNLAEQNEMSAFITWLFSGTTTNFQVMSATVFAAVVGLSKVGVHVATSGPRKYESQLIVLYSDFTEED